MGALNSEEMIQWLVEELKDGDEIPFVVGDKGTGKTDIVMQAIKEVGYDSIWSHPAVQNPTHFSGYGYPDKSGDFAKHLPYDDLKKAMEVTKPTVWVFDDFGQASDEVQKAVMQLLLGKKLNGKEISKHIRFILLSNRKEDKAGVRGILEPIKGRTCIVPLSTDPKCWIKWAEKNGVAPEGIAFIEWQPQFLYEFKPTTDMTNSPNPRNITMAFKALSKNFSERILETVIEGRTGVSFASAFCSFLKIMRKMISPVQLLADPSLYVEPTGKEKVAILFALARTLATKADKKNMGNIAVLAEKFPAEFGTLMMTLIERNKPELIETAGYVGWAVKNGKNVI